VPKPPPINRHTITAPTDAPGTRLRSAWEIPLDRIEANPWQPRQHADATKMQELIDDIRVRGILQPLVLRDLENGQYQVVAGERRYRAARALELGTVPAIIQALTEAEARAASIRENVHREDMDPEDEGRYYQSLQDMGLSLRDIGDAIGKSHQYVYRRIALVEKPGALAAYRAGQANLADLAGEWAPAAPVPMAEADGILAPDPADDAAAGGETVLPHAAIPPEAHAIPGLGTGLPNPDLDFSFLDDPAPPADPAPREAGAPAANRGTPAFRRRQAIYKPFQMLSQHVRRLAPAVLPAAEQQELWTTIQTLKGELATLEAQLAEAQNPGPAGERPASAQSTA